MVIHGNSFGVDPNRRENVGSIENTFNHKVDNDSLGEIIRTKV